MPRIILTTDPATVPQEISVLLMRPSARCT
jgi:hypothetical protein